MRIGVDIDGVLADFNRAFVARVVQETGRNLFPADVLDVIPCWNYPEHYGYTKGEVSRTWAKIKADPLFWFDISVYPDTRNAQCKLDDAIQNYHDVYFVTARPGIRAKEQTEAWLRLFYAGFLPTVLISSAKGAVAAALELDYYIDDKFENCIDVVRESPGTFVALLTRSWNEKETLPLLNRLRRVESIGDFLNQIKADSRYEPDPAVTAFVTASRLNTSGDPA